jgi:hypothetical protein
MRTVTLTHKTTGNAAAQNNLNLFNSEVIQGGYKFAANHAYKHAAGGGSYSCGVLLPEQKTGFRS